MTETWLRPNVRPIFFAMILPGAGLLASCALLAGAYQGNGPFWLTGLGWLIVTISMASLLSLWKMARQPRLAYDGEHLQVHLGTRQNFAVPIDIVECFFPGQGPAMLPPTSGQGNSRTETSTVVIRLADAAQEWSHREVRPEFGRWCDGYIAIRGTWCEHIDSDLIRNLNQRLSELQQRRKKKNLRQEEST